MLVRLCPADEDEVADLLKAGHMESRYRNRPYDEARARAVLRVFLENPATFARGALDADGRIVGVMLAELSQPLWWSSERVANMAVLYVRPENRGGAGLRLLLSFKAWAKGSRADVVSIGASSGIDEDRTAQLFGRLGFVRGATFWELEG